MLDKNDLSDTETPYLRERSELAYAS